MKEFIQITWQQIVAGAISLIFLGAITFIFTQIDKSMDKTEENEKRIQDIETIMESGLNGAINNLEEQLRSTNSRLGSISSNQRNIELALERLNTIIEILEDN